MLKAYCVTLKGFINDLQVTELRSSPMLPDDIVLMIGGAKISPTRTGIVEATIDQCNYSRSGTMAMA